MAPPSDESCSHGLTPDPARFRRWLTVVLVWVFLAALLMTALYYHWLGDISCGWALGALAVAVATTILHAPP